MVGLDSYEVPQKERAHSLTATYLSTGDHDVIIVGTAIQKAPGEEPQEGRILTFMINPQRKLQLISQTPVPGCVYSMDFVDGKLVATVNGMTCLYQWSKSENDATFAWRHLHSHFGQILGVKIDVRGNLVAVGDLMKSVNLLSVSDGKLTELARDYDSNWMTEVHFISEDEILGSDNLGNLFVLSCQRDENFIANRSDLSIKSAFHIGEVVNRISKGTLARNQDLDREGIHGAVLHDPLIICTTAGSIYQFGKISLKYARPLKILESNLVKLLPPIGGLSHADWRRMVTERKKLKEVDTFIDGDMIARYLELDHTKQRIACEGGLESCDPTGLSTDQITSAVEVLVSLNQ